MVAIPDRICLFGGSFDPVHEGHLHIARAAQAACRLSRVVFLPAACSPFKQEQRTMFTDEQRLELLQLAIDGIPWAEVSPLDLQLPPPSWSWRLVEHYRRLAPQAELYWLMGTDQWQALHRWARYDYLTCHLRFIVYHRDTPPEPRPGVRSHFISGVHPASSSVIRAALQGEAPLPDGWLNNTVEARIRQWREGNRTVEIAGGNSSKRG